MVLLLLEALAVLGIAIFIVWWTMFSGRGKEGDAASAAAEKPRVEDGRIEDGKGDGN